MWMILKDQWIDVELKSDDEDGCVYVRSKLMNNSDTKITVWICQLNFILLKHLNRITVNRA